MKHIFSFLILAGCILRLHAQPPVLGSVFQGETITAQDLKPSMQLTGEFTDGIKWKDKSGENYFILTYQPGKDPKVPQRDLYVYQYRVTTSGTSLAWKIQDFSGALCEMEFIYNSLQIIDLDGDGTMEACFMYQNQCDGLDPWQTKLMFFKDGKKFAIRGSFDPESQKQVSKTIDPEVTNAPGIFRQFMLLNWEEFAGGEFEFTKSVALRSEKYIVLDYEYCFASGGTSYRILKTDGTALTLPVTLAEKYQYASTLELMPDGKSLFYASTKGVGILDPILGKDTPFMTFLETTESISGVSWSPDYTRLAFAALNFSYPKRTRVFVLDIQGNMMVRKQQFDVPVFHMAASEWVVSAPRLNDLRDRVYFQEMDLSGDGPVEGPEKMILLD